MQWIIHTAGGVAVPVCPIVVFHHLSGRYSWQGETKPKHSNKLD